MSSILQSIKQQWAQQQEKEAAKKQLAVFPADVVQAAAQLLQDKLPAQAAAVRSVARAQTQQAQDKLPEAMQVAIHSVTASEYQALAKALLTKDQPLFSNRVWSLVYVALSAVLFSVELEEQLGSLLAAWPAYVPLALAALAAARSLLRDWRAS